MKTIIDVTRTKPNIWLAEFQNRNVKKAELMTYSVGSAWYTERSLHDRISSKGTYHLS